MLFDYRLDEILKKASLQDLTESLSEAEKAIKEHNELNVCAIGDLYVSLEHVNINVSICIIKITQLLDNCLVELNPHLNIYLHFFVIK